MQTQETTTADTAQTAPVDGITVTLDYPFKRGDTELHTVHLRKPMAGELRGIKLTELLALDVGAVQKLLPRITSPTMTAHEVASLDPADLAELAMEVASFFVRKSARAAFLTA